MSADVSDRQEALAATIAEQSTHLQAESLLAAPEDAVEAIAEALEIDAEAAEATANVEGPDVDDFDAGVIDG